MNNPHAETPAQFYGAKLDEARLVVILLHARRQEASVAYQLGERIGLNDVAYVVPIAKDKTWYPHSFMKPVEDNQPLLNHALACVDGVVLDLESRGIARTRMVFMGFSQGGCLASEYLYRHPGQWGGLVAFTGGLFGAAGTTWSTPAAMEGTRVFLGTSDIDGWVPLERVRETAAVFRAMGAQVDECVYPNMEHTVNDDEIAAAHALLLETGAYESTIGFLPRQDNTGQTREALG